MKLTSLFIYYIIPTSLLLCGGPCCPEEEETTYLYIDNHNIISISDNATTFNVDDVIFIESIVENTQTTIDNQNIILKNYFLYQDEPHVTLTHSLTLYKESSFGSLTAIPISEEYLEFQEGKITTNNSSSYPNIQITSNLKGETFKTKFGIKLKERGTYYLSSTNYNTQSNGLIQISGGDYSRGIIEIRTRIINSDDKGLYKFVVN